MLRSAVYSSSMHETFVQSLRGVRTQICARWEAFLRIERVSTPLANPDTLVYLFDHTLDEVFAALNESPAAGSAVRPVAASEGNPLNAYFRACEQALFEALIQIQAKVSALDPKER